MNEIENILKEKPIVLPRYLFNYYLRLGITPEEALVLEDSEAGITAAHAGNIDVTCAPDMKYPEEEFASKTLKIVDSLLDVIEHLK